jgi:hypothetical protein
MLDDDDDDDYNKTNSVLYLRAYSAAKMLIIK